MGWQQSIFDLMSNHSIKLAVIGKMGEVNATLIVEQDQPWRPLRTCAEVVGAEDFDSAMDQVIAMYKAKGN